MRDRPNKLRSLQIWRLSGILTLAVDPAVAGADVHLCETGYPEDALAKALEGTGLNREEDGDYAGPRTA